MNNFIRRILFFILFCLSFCTNDQCFAAKWNESGHYSITWYNKSQSNFKIKSAAELAGVAYLLNNGYTNFEGKTITLSSDIDLSPCIWITAGNSERPFKGIFDGAGHTIFGLDIRTESDSNKKYFGLFGEIREATIKNLNISGKIRLNFDSYFPEQWVGSFAASGYLGTLTNCMANVYIEYHRKQTNSEKYNLYMGGMIGKDELSNLEYCLYKGKIVCRFGENLTDMYFTGGGVYIGGMCGSTSGSQWGTNGIIIGCGAEFEDVDIITANSRNTKNGMPIIFGGLFGNGSKGSIKYSYALLPFIRVRHYSKSAGNMQIGGIAGSYSDFNSEAIKNCYSIIGNIDAGASNSNTRLCYGGISGGGYTSTEPYVANFSNNDININETNLPKKLGLFGSEAYSSGEMKTNNFLDELNLYSVLKDGNPVWHITSIYPIPIGNKMANCDSPTIDTEIISESDCLIYNLNGQAVDDSTESLSPGIYIIKNGSNVKKIFVR